MSSRVILSGGLLAGTLDLIAAFVIYGDPVRVLQSIASGLLGADSYNGELSTAVLGGVLHFGIAVGAAAVYCVARVKISLLANASTLSGLLYGVAVFAFMHWVVLPLSAFPHKLSYSPGILARGLIVHMFCIGLPISFVANRFASLNDRSSS